MSFQIEDITPVYSSAASLAPVVASVIPDTDNAYDLGTVSMNYNDIFMKGNLYVNTKDTLHDDTLNSQIELTANNYNVSINTTGTGITKITSVSGVEIGTAGVSIDLKGPLTAEQSFTTNNVTDLSASGINTRVRGTLQVDQATTFASTVSITGQLLPDDIAITTNTNPLSITGSNGVDIDIAGEFAIDTTDTTNGISIGETTNVPIGIGNGTTYPVTIGSTLDVNENVTFTKALTVNGNSLNLGNPGGSGITNIRNSLTVNENATVLKDLDVDGLTTLDSTTIDITGGSFGVSGTGTSLINTTGSNDIQSTTSIDIGTTSAIPVIIGNGSGSILLDGDTTIDGTVIINNSAGFTAQSVIMNLGTLGGTIGLLGATTMSRPFVANDTTTLNNTLNVSGLATFTGGITTSGANDIDLVTTTGDINLTTASGTITASNLTVTGESNIAGTVDLTGVINAPLENTFGTSGNTNTVLGNFDVNENMNIDGTLTVDLTSLLTGAVTSSTSLTSNTLTTLNGSTNISGSVDVNASTYDMDATGLVSIDTTDLVNGIKIGTLNNAPINIGKSGSILTIPADTTLSGITTIINSTISAIEDVFVLTNINETGAGVSGAGVAGIQIDRGTEDDAFLQWNEINDNFEYGTVGSFNTIATEGTQNTNGIVYYDGTNIVSGTDLTWNSGLNINNIKISTNTISSTDTNGNINLTADGTGIVAIDNFSISGNTISSTNTNGDIILTADGTGSVDIDNIAVSTNTISSTNVNGDISLTPNGTGSVVINNISMVGNDIKSTSTDINLKPTRNVIITDGSTGTTEYNPSDVSLIVRNNTTPSIILDDTGGGDNTRLFSIDNDGGVFSIGALNDSGSRTASFRLQRAGWTDNGFALTAATGGYKGRGTLNAEGLYVNGNTSLTTDTLTFGNSVGNIVIPDNNSSSLVIKEGSNAYITFDTTNSAEKILFNKNVDIDGGSIDSVTLGTNSPITELEVDNVNINGNTIAPVTGHLVLNGSLNSNTTIDNSGTGYFRVDDVSVSGSNISVPTDSELDIDFGKTTGHNLNGTIERSIDNMRYVAQNWHRISTYNSNTTSQEENFFIGSYAGGQRGAGVRNGDLYIMDLGTSGDIHIGAGSKLVNVSDQRLKTDLPYENKYGLNEIKQISGVKYYMNDDENQEEQIGFYAQDFENVIPECIGNNTEWVVETDINGKFLKNEDGSYIYKLDHNDEKIIRYKSFNTRPLLAALIEAVKELSAEIEILKGG